jgi:hypothetical protein
MWWLAIFAAGCGSGGDAVPLPSSIEKVADRDGQSAPAGGRLGAPLAVEVRASDGTAVGRAEVRWTVTAGSGAELSDSVTRSDGGGRAEVVLRLGPLAGSYTVRAALKLNADRAVTFQATATAPPAITAVSPGQFAGGDTVVIQGSAFEAGALVDIGGVPARVLSVNPAGTQITAVAPACLVPGTVSVVVRVRTAPSNVATATYVASGGVLRLAVGDYAAVAPAAISGCAVFPAAGTDSVKYLLAPQLVTERTGDTVGYRLRGDSALAATWVRGAGTLALPYAVQFHDWLRHREQEYAKLPYQRPVLRAAPAAPSPAAVSQRRTFRVCNTVRCSAAADFTEVTADLRYVGRHAAIYQDVAAPTGGLTDADFQSVGQLFDNDLYDVDATAFGAESDVDGNGLVLILFTPVVNKLTPKEQCSQSFVTGFFFAIDIEPAFQNDTRSNQAEVFYAIVPDPQEAFTCRFTVTQVRRLVPVTFIHEFQHMISYYQHRMLRAGSGEVLWLNEAMSHLAEELGGFHFLAQGDSTQFSNFVLGNLFNGFKYLKNPGAQAVFAGDGTGTLEERGAGWLFLRWLVDQFGTDLTRRLSETALTGAANVAAATGEPVASLLPQWFLANYVSDLPGFSAPARLRYRTWSFRKTYADLNRQSPSNFDRPFPLAPAVFPGGTFNVSGTLRAASGEYFIATQLPGQRSFAIQFTDGTGSAFLPSVPARLDVIRLR